MMFSSRQGDFQLISKMQVPDGSFDWPTRSESSSLPKFQNSQLPTGDSPQPARGELAMNPLRGVQNWVNHQLHA